MLRVIIRQARPGMSLARSVINPRQPDQTLLPAGSPLDVTTIARLHELGVFDLWVEYPGLEFLDDLYSPQLTGQQQRICETLRTSFHEHARRTGAGLPVQQFRAAIEELIRAILACTTALPFMSMLASVDDALLRHSSEVCVLGVMLGLRLEGYLVEQRRRITGRQASDVVNLGLGCMLHDIGELQLPAEHRESHRFRLADEDGEPERWKGHAELGYTAVRGQVEPSAATVVLNHHQHFDGTGFPATPGGGAPWGSQIHVFARVAMAADTFQHLLHRDGMPVPAVCALSEIQQNPLRQWFDPVVLGTLLSVVPPFLPGMLVTLSDSRQAIVTQLHEDAPCYPAVQVLDGFDLLSPVNMGERREAIDLATTPGLHVSAVDGFDVAKFLYGPRATAGAAGKAPQLQPMG